MPGSKDELYSEGHRVMGLCKICSFCSGLCEVFRAAQRQGHLSRGDLEHLAHLCHNCRACWYACQYAPPHEFAINVPATLARVRAESYARHAWPAPMRALARQGATLTTGAALALALLMPLLTLCLVPNDRLFAAHTGSGAFYEIIPLDILSNVASLTFAFAVIAAGVAIRQYRRAEAGPAQGIPRSHPVWPMAIRDALTLRNLDGGGAGCNDLDGRLTQWRRMAHHALFYGFALCFAATLAGGFYHHVLGHIAPYSLFSLPSLLGTIGGMGMVLGAGGMLTIKRLQDRRPTAPKTLADGNALLLLLLGVATSGLLLQFLRATPAMGLLLAFHLGTVMALFLVAPYSKMIHGAYRLAALVRAAGERRRGTRGKGPHSPE